MTSINGLQCQYRNSWDKSADIVRVQRVSFKIFVIEKLDSDGTYQICELVHGNSERVLSVICFEVMLIDKSEVIFPNASSHTFFLFIIIQFA